MTFEQSATLKTQPQTSGTMGYIGLYEATSVFYGKNWMRDHGWDPQGTRLPFSRRRQDVRFRVSAVDAGQMVRDTPTTT